MTNNLNKLGFHTATTERAKALIMSVCGLEKQGKTHFSLTAPGEIAIINTDIGLQGVVQKFADQKKIHVLPITVYHDTTEADKEWDKLKAALKELVLNTDIQTVVLDTATELWELLRIAKFGKLANVQPWHYGPVNAEYRSIIKMFYDDLDNPIKNLIALHKMKPMYVNDKRTSEYERSGFSDMGYLVQVNAQVYRDNPYTDEDDVPHKGNFHINIRDCRHDPSLNGSDFETDFDDPDAYQFCSFPFIASMIVEGTTPEDWE